MAKFLDLKYGIPSLSTIRKTMALVDPQELEEVCVKIIIKKVKGLTDLLIKNETNEENENEKDIITYDGKVCRGSSRKNTAKG